MDVAEDLLELDWDGPLSGVDIPELLLYGAVLSFAVAKGPALLDSMRRLLEPLFGQAKERKSLLGGTRLEWTGRMNAEARVRGGRATLQFAQRVKGKRVAEAVQALAALPEARDLKLKAGVRRFGRDPGSAPLDG